ncbi:biotin--[acetyl-CoA-carboxylase] ligase [Deltaproteobacteria bacterium]|nr:biotin--[acetyl-CoA-carboxylase] ligase [Deltaproteobacteria bacterium]
MRQEKRVVRTGRDDKLRGSQALPRSETFAFAGWELFHFATLDSTNREAHRRAACGLAEKTVILADCQTAGQGRHARTWESASGKGLWVSLLVPVSVPFSCLPQSTLVLAVAVREAIAAATGIDLQIKWPNDLLARGRKCCGLLVESAAMPSPPEGSALSLILGIGINLTQTEEDFPPFLREKAASLFWVSGREHGREQILREVLRHVEQWFGLWAAQGFAPARAAWLAHNCTVGRRLILPDGYGYTCGFAADLAPDGALVARADDGVLLPIASGEIRFSDGK